jgi:microcystin-dependent protein
MKPLNLDNSPCSPISSNCVIWQGPNIPCINLCTGDTVSDVVYKLALELCEILDQLNITNYDLACLNLPCPPADFQALIQILINKICELQNIPTPAPQPDGGNCPTNCIVAVADCLGGGTDNLLNYVNTIANKVCDLVGDIHDIQNSIATINTTLNFLQEEINNIPVYTLPDIAVPIGCTIGPYTGPTNVALDTLFEEFLQDWCAYISTVGTAADFASVLSPACTLSGSAYFGADIVSEPGWINPPTNLADAISNIWTSICFFYNFNYAQTVVTGSGGITVTSSYDAPTNTTTYNVAPSVPFTTLMPTGSVLPWAGTSGTAPVGWAFCDGTLYDGSLAAYSALFAVIGQTYGGVGPTGFNVPNLANSIPVGIGTNSDGYDLTTVGNFGGDKAIALSAAEVAPHTHNVAGTTSGTFVDLITASTDSTGGDPAADPRTGDYTRLKVGADGNLQQDDHAQQFSAHTHTFSATTDTGSGVTGSAHGNMQPYVVMQYIIKL